MFSVQFVPTLRRLPKSVSIEQHIALTQHHSSKLEINLSQYMHITGMIPNRKVAVVGAIRPETAFRRKSVVTSTMRSSPS